MKGLGAVKEDLPGSRVLFARAQGCDESNFPLTCWVRSSAIASITLTLRFSVAWKRCGSRLTARSTGGSPTWRDCRGRRCNGCWTCTSRADWLRCEHFTGKYPSARWNRTGLCWRRSFVSGLRSRHGDRADRATDPGTAEPDAGSRVSARHVEAEVAEGGRRSVAAETDVARARRPTSGFS